MNGVKVIRHTDKRSMVDLYAGLGGASESMLQTGWDVLRIDNNPLLNNVENMVIRDIKTIKPKRTSKHKIDLVWASPPCLEFSTGYNAPRPTALRAGVEFEPDMSLLEEAIRMIDALEPRYYCIENVVGAIKDFEPYLGPPTQIIGSFVLWHNLPHIVMPNDFHHKKTDFDPGYQHPLRSNHRAKIPFEISEAVRTCIEFQKSIIDY